ncbi:MAG: glycosyltransferase [Lewinellaceae bacterium]|nr:glycosyltransferase [Lewinellaceae bacterium]
MLLGLYVLTTIIQLVVWWGVFGKLGFRKNSISNHQSPVTSLPAVALAKAGHQSPITSHQSPITIIICARNEAENLRRYLPAVLAQQFKQPWELLVVDDASEDKTPAVLQDFQKKNPERMRVLRIDQKIYAGKKHALAQGIAAAKHDHLLLTDADCLPASPLWLAHMAAMLMVKPETEIVLGYGPCFADEMSGQTT